MNENEKFLCIDKFQLPAPQVLNAFHIFHYLLYVRSKQIERPQIVVGLRDTSETATGMVILFPLHFSAHTCTS